MHEVLQKGKELGEFHHLIRELDGHDDQFFMTSHKRKTLSGQEKIRSARCFTEIAQAAATVRRFSLPLHSPVLIL